MVYLIFLKHKVKKHNKSLVLQWTYMYDKTASDAKTNDSKPGFLAVYKSTGPILRSTKHHLFHATRREVSTKGDLGACSPRTFLKLYRLKCHFLSSNKKQFSRQALSSI